MRSSSEIIQSKVMWVRSHDVNIIDEKLISQILLNPERGGVHISLTAKTLLIRNDSYITL